MRVWRRLGPLLVVVLALNLVPMVSAPSGAIADERPALTYFALGDSYASGHGLFDDGEPCRRSSLAYPYRIKDALSANYEQITFHHYACSGATAGPNSDLHPYKTISDQFEIVNAFLDHRDRTGGSATVLVTITIGANDVGLDRLSTWLKVLRSFPTSAFAFFEWLDDKSAPIGPSLTTGIDDLLSHEDVYIVLTDYPNPFAEGVFGGDCNDLFNTLTCDDAIKRILERLNSIVLDQFSRVGQPDRLRVAPLGPSFSTHHSTCGVESMPISQTWFQLAYHDSQRSMLDNIEEYADACFHPNASGAQAIADAVVDLARVMLPVSVTPEDDRAGPAAPPVAWPSDRNDGPPSLFIWLGANMYGFPDWVACDDATTYCLVGYPGAAHVLIQISGFAAIGEVDDSAPDPRGALLALGLPDEVVTQILGQ